MRLASFAAAVTSLTMAGTALASPPTLPLTRATNAVNAYARSHIRAGSDYQINDCGRRGRVHVVCNVSEFNEDAFLLGGQFDTRQWLRVTRTPDGHIVVRSFWTGDWRYR